jgi:HAE1 family hydrophobic/amphiphilic exporter-1
MLVDNSIVVLENIFRHRQEGEGALEASVSGSNEVAMAVTASTLTTVAVFLPIVFVQGITAQFFKELALTVTFSLLSSLIVSLTIVPLFSSRLMALPENPGRTAAKQDSGIKRILSRLLDAFAGFYEKLEQQYGSLLKWALSHRKTVVLVSLVLFVFSMALLPVVGTEFLPQSDSGTIDITVKMPDGTNLDTTDGYVARLEDRIKSIREVQGIMANVGTSTSNIGGESGQSNMASVTVKLVPMSERKRSSQEVAEEIRKIAQSMAGAEVKVRATSAIDFGGSGLLKPISIEIKGDDFARLKEISEKVADIVKSVPGTREVESSLERGRPELVISIDREKATLYGLSSAQIARAVNSAVAGSTATKLKVGGDEIDVVIKAEENLVDQVEKVKSISIPSPSGALITLADVAAVEKSTGPVTINRDDQTRAVTVTGEVVGRAVGTVNREIQRRLEGIKLPEGYSIKMGGEQEQMVEAFRDLILAFILAVILVYMVMAAQFESLVQPFVIMFTVPLALIGVVFALLVTARHFNMPAFIGVIMLAGIVVNNAIVLVDYINQLRHKGMSRTEAIIKAGPVRLRPILMTALTTILGLLPLALGLGEGGEMRAPMATAVIGGLTISTLLTLVVIPVVYTIMEDIVKIWTGFWKRIRRTRISMEPKILS